MPTPAERQALLFVAAVAALGVGVRGCRALEPPTAAADRTALAAQMAAVDSAVASGGARRPTTSRRRRPTTAVAAAPKAESRDPVGFSVGGGPGASAGVAAVVDVDIASAAELDRLPGIGPSLAGRIVADREARGPFGSLQGLERVKGIGPALAAKLAPHVTFSLSPRPSDTEVPPRERVSP